MWNASWPLTNSYAGIVRAPDNRLLTIAFNDHVALPDGAFLEWESIEGNSEIMAIFADGAMDSHLPLLERVYDLKGWFRQLSIDETDHWKNIYHVRGGVRQEVRLKMGHSAAVNYAQRLSIILVRIINEAAVEEGWGIQKYSTSTSMAKLRNGATIGEIVLADNHSKECL